MDACGYGILKFRGDARFIQPLWNTDPDEIPIDERFFLGGDNTIRGYRSYKLGPKFKNNEPRGGISFQIFSAEFIRPIFSKLDVFLFFDAGHLSLKEWHVGRFNLSTGYGCRFEVFENGPPLVLGMGYPLNKKDKSDVKKFFLMIGGRF